MAFIKKTTIEKINDEELSKAVEYVLNIDLKRKGSNYFGKSPFNEEKSASFSVSNGKRIWKCFSSGKSGTNIIGLVMEVKGLDFINAVEICANALKIPIAYGEETPEEKDKREKSEILLDILNKAKNTYHSKFNKLPDDHWAKDYLINKREFDLDTINLFDIGYSSDDNYLTAILKNEGKFHEALELGLVRQKTESSISYDFFKDRIMFPIYDHKAKCVGFGGRVKPGVEYAKYFNSDESKVYNKSQLLYGLNLAYESIRKFEFAFLVEGYTDVMRMHQVGLSNTVASCGTALTKDQVKLLKKYTSRVVIFRDGDNAGMQAAFRDMEILLQEGFIVEIVIPEVEGEDPDSIGQRLKDETKDYVTALIQDAIIYKVQHFNKIYLEKAQKEWDAFVEKTVEEGGKAPKAKKLLISGSDKIQLYNVIWELLSKIQSKIIYENYKEQIAQKFQFKKTEFNEYLKDKDHEKASKERSRIYDFSDEEEMYELPPDVTVTLQEVIFDIKKYGFFQSDNRIWFMEKDIKPPYHFYPISNFQIEIVQHMQDESKPMKLIRMSNIEKYEVIFDVPSNKINTLASFIDMCTDYGNFFFDGEKSEHKTLIRVLMQKMGHGRKIDILGWQPEGFWVWNNKVVIPGERTEDLNEEGLFKYKNNSYYIPSANSIYAENHFKYTAQKKFTCFETETTLDNYLLAMSKVHREHAITGILFAIASLYQNVICDKLGFFPLLFYFGPASTGKDNLAEAIQSFVGKPQSAINLEGNVSTIKAQIREFAQFSNGISQLSEYKRGNPQLDGVLKGLWDRRGYKRGNVDSFVGTEEIPILSAAILTGNDYPDAQALITRLIWDEMAKNEFSEEDKRNYNDLKDIVKKGISGLSNYFINLIFEFEERFLDMYRTNKVYLNGLEGLTKDETPARIIDNLSVLFTVFTFFEDRIRFPFGRTEILKHFENMANNQRAKLKGTSPINKFWDIFLICMRINNGDQIKIDVDIKRDGDLLLFNFTNIYGRIQRQWFLQYRNDPCPAKSEMRDLLKNEPFYREEKKSERIHKNVNSNTSAMVLDLTKIEICNEILTQIEIQRNKGTLLDPDLENDNDKVDYE